MVLEPLEEILKEFPDLDEEKLNFAKKLYAALSGEVKRDTLPNYGKLLSDKTRENAAPLDKDEEDLVEEFRVALYGGMVRDTLDNEGRSFTGDALAESAKRCNALIDDPEFQALLLKL